MFLLVNCFLLEGQEVACSFSFYARCGGLVYGNCCLWKSLRGQVI